MAYTQVHTITDTDRRHVTKRVNSANTETDTLVVNASALSYAIQTMTTVASSNNFMVGEVVTAGSGGTAVVQDCATTDTLVLTGVTGTFAPGDTVTGGSTGRVRTQSGSLVANTYVLQVARIIYNVFGDGHVAKVELMWQGTGGGANNRTIAILSGDGTLEFDTFAGRIPNNANSATGNITLSCLGWSANAHYTLLVDVNKLGGYAPPYYDRNTLGRY